MALAGPVFFGGESAAHGRLGAEDGEEACRDGSTEEGIGAVLASEIENRPTVGSHIFKGSVLALPIEKVGWRDGEVTHPRKAFGGRDVPNLHDAGGVLVGEGAEEDGVHHGENRGVGANA